MSDRQSQHALPIGFRLHRFQIESILGVGGFGITYLARGGDRQGPWTDVFALGATLYRAVSGKGPVDSLDRAGAILKGHKDVLVPATMMGEGRCSASFLRAIERALAFQPEAPPQTIAEWRVLLEEQTHAGFGAVGISARRKTGTRGRQLAPRAGICLIKRPCVSVGRGRRNPYR